MPESNFDVDALRAALERLDLADVARRTIEAAEDYMPGCAWLEASGVAHYAETMSEVDGLVLCQARSRTRTMSSITATGSELGCGNSDLTSLLSDLKQSLRPPSLSGDLDLGPRTRV